jgi:ubiquinone/menaquinone biosynthesis C-methylase UbiE
VTKTTRAVRDSNYSAGYAGFLRDEDRKVVQRLGIEALELLATNREKWTLPEGYHNEHQTYYGRVHMHLRGSLVKLKPKSKILDWGSSRGVTTIELANIYPDCDVTGIDVRRFWKAFSEYLVEEIAKNPSYLKNYLHSDLRVGYAIPRQIKFPKEFISADGFDAPFANGTFDAVFCMNNIYYVLTQMESAKAKERLRQVTRLVKRGGYLVVSGADISEGEVTLAVLQKQSSGEMELMRMRKPSWSGFEKIARLTEACCKEGVYLSEGMYDSPRTHNGYLRTS